MSEANQGTSLTRNSSAASTAPAIVEEGGMQQNVRQFDIGAMWQVTSMCLGIGIFSMPYCFLKLGIAAAFFWMILLSVCAAVGMLCLLDMAAMNKLDSYEAIAELAFGKCGKVIMASLTCVTTFIATLSYMGAGCTLVSNMIVQFFLGFDVNSQSQDKPVIILDDTKHAILLTIFALIVCPKCFSKSLGAHEWISTFSVITVSLSGLVFVGLCVYYLAQGCEHRHCGDAAPLVTNSVSETLQYVATLAFSFSMVFAVFPVMKDRLAKEGVRIEDAAKDMKPVVIGSVVLSSCIYCIVGFMGAVTFGSLAKPLAINNLALSNYVALAISLVVGINCLLLVPVICFPTLESAELLLATCRPEGQDLPAYTRPGLVIMLAVAIVFVDTFLPTKIAFALAGGLGLSLSAYILPSAFFFKLADRSYFKWLVLLVMLVGSALLFAATPVTLASLLSGDSDIGKNASPQTLAQAFCSTSCNCKPDVVTKISV